ncbi:colicin D domain-containing protein [uncultured Mucilaginibacter sp.]|uniref:colicin D domain-containing protein n=1 Tax=uncultured Mucilaginibacter sp. TaxID=797541 RepID=UPI00345C5940
MSKRHAWTGGEGLPLLPELITYRGTQQVLHYFDPKSGLDVMTDLSGNLVGGWKLSIDQTKYLLTTGNVK